MLALSHLTHLGQECVAPAGLESAAESFRRDGVAVLKAFAEPDEVATMRLSMEAMVEDWWQSERAGGGGDEHVFRTDGDQAAAQGSKDYFMSSGDKVRFFEEPGTHSRDAAKAPPLNKVGHGLHLNASSPFGAYARSSRVAAVAREVAGLRAAVLPQSMYIFKSGVVGGAVTSHQDASFLYTRPVQTVVGLWLALHDAHEENGCLWARRGSHREPLRRRFVRSLTEDGEAMVMAFTNVSYTRKPGARPTLEQEEASLSPRLLGEHDYHHSPPEPTANASHVAASERAREWEGSWPPAQARPDAAAKAALAERGFEPLAVSAGDLVVIAGTLDHLSLPNHSPNDRHTYQLHMVEGPAGGVHWAHENWLQLEEGRFMSLGVELHPIDSHW
jgi:phytanoyl-CoA hydroxylase